MSEAWDQTHILMDTSWVGYHWATTGTPTHKKKIRGGKSGEEKEKEGKLAWKVKSSHIFKFAGAWTGEAPGAEAHVKDVVKNLIALRSRE